MEATTWYSATNSGHRQQAGTVPQIQDTGNKLAQCHKFRTQATTQDTQQSRAQTRAENRLINFLNIVDWNA
jgi:hypothetical protein